MKTKKIPFDIEKAKAGAKIVTKNGLNVTIREYLDDKSYNYPIEAIVKNPTGTSRDTLYYSKEGRLLISSECDLDLLIEEVEETDDYDPYKEVVKSISDMVEKYTELQSIEELKDFYDNIKVKCREAIEYDKKWCKKQEEHRHSVILKIMPNQWYVCTLGWEDDWKFLEGASYHGSEILQCDSMDEEEIQNHFRPWSINDAKEGDVLVKGSNIFIFHFINDTFIMGFCHINTDDDGFYIDLGKLDGVCLIDDVVTPATKEQCNFLFQKMKEAGYEWNSDKNELHKIEAKFKVGDKVVLKRDKSLVGSITFVSFIGTYSVKFKDFNACWYSEQELEPYEMIEKKVKTRSMTNQELADWLRKCPEEFREFTFKDGASWVYSYLDYLDSEADEPAKKNKLIRRNHGEWQEPLIEE